MSAAAPDAAALAHALGAAGLPCAVEGRDRLAVIVPAAGSAAALAGAARRDQVVRLAADHGFTHVALELTPPARPTTPPASGAAVPRP